jgi:hypothetical protein
MKAKIRGSVLGHVAASFVRAPVWLRHWAVFREIERAPQLSASVSNLAKLGHRSAIKFSRNKRGPWRLVTYYTLKANYSLLYTKQNFRGRLRAD